MCFDMADSYVVGIAGLLNVGVLNSDIWRKKYMSL